MKYPTPYDNEHEEGFDLDNYEAPYSEQMDYHQPAPQPVVKQYALPKYDKKNIFSLPSVVGIFMFVLSTSFMAVYNAVEDEKITLQEKLLIGYLIAGGVSEVILRGSEGATAVYSPKGLPGRDKDFYDENGNGVDDRLE